MKEPLVGLIPAAGRGLRLGLPYPKQTIKMSNPFRINAEKVREHNSRKTSFSKWQARYEPDE